MGWLPCLEEHAVYPLADPAMAQLHVDEAGAGKRGPLCNHGGGGQRVHNGGRHVCGLLWGTLLEANTAGSSDRYLSLHKNKQSASAISRQQRRCCILVLFAEAQPGMGAARWQLQRTLPFMRPNSCMALLHW